MSEFEYLMTYARQRGEIAALQNAANTIEALRYELSRIAATIPRCGEDVSVAYDVLAYVLRAEHIEKRMKNLLDSVRDLEQRNKKLEAVARALLECEAERAQKCTEGVSFAPDMWLYLKAVSLAKIALETGLVRLGGE